MHKIGNEQIAAMEDAQWQEYYRRLMSFFRDTVPTQTSMIDDDSLLKIIAGGVRKAREHGVVSGEAIVRFVGLAILIGPTFDDNPAVRHYLNTPDIDPDFKVHVLADLTAKELRSKASQNPAIHGL